MKLELPGCVDRRATARGYCVQATVNGITTTKNGQKAPVAAGRC